MLQSNKRLRRLIARNKSQKAARTTFKDWINQSFTLLMIYSVLLMAVPARGLVVQNQNAFKNQSEQSSTVQKQKSETSKLSETKQENKSNDSLAAEPSGQTATELENGDILIVGGNTAKIYFAASGNFGATGAPLSQRQNHAAVRLIDGRVLITGGSIGKDALRSTEIFDPSSGSFSPAAEMNFGRSGHTATLLHNGKVLISGGGNAELYDPSANTFETIASTMKVLRSNHSTALLNDGRILIVGGTDEKGTILNISEIYNPSTNEFVSAGEMKNARKNAVLRALPDGKIQIIGGANDPSMEIFDANGSVFGARVKIPENGNEFPELFNDIMSSPSRAAVIGKNVIELPQVKQALVYADGNGLQNGKVFNSSKATITTEALNYPAGKAVIVSGKGFMPSETVELVFYQTENSKIKNQPRFTVQTNENGEFRFDGYTPEESNGSFLIDAKGTMSGEKAQTSVENIRSINSVTLNGGSAVTVGPGETITVVATVTLDNDSNWDGTGWYIATAPLGPSAHVGENCVDHADHTSGNPPTIFIETFTITAPPTLGTYNAYFRAYANSACTGGTSSYTPLQLDNSVIVRNASTTTLSSSLNPSAVGDEVAFTATVSGSAGTPTGSVEFFDGSISLGAVTLSSGSATLSSSTLTGGSHTIKAVYSGSSVPSYAPSEATLTQTVDATPPTATVSNAYTTPTNANSIEFSVAFSEPVTGADLEAGYTVVNGSVDTVTGSGSTRTVTVIPTADGAVTLSVNAGVATDAVGNENTASNISSVTSDRTKPTATVSSGVNPTNANPIDFTVNFSESVTGGSTATDYTVSNGTIGTIIGSGSTRTVSVTPSADGVVTLKLNAATATDTAGNTNNESNTGSVTFDSTMPSVTVMPLTGLTNTSPIVFNIHFSESVTGFGDISDYVSNGTVVIAAIDGDDYTASVTPGGQGAVTFAVNANAAFDSSNNGNTASATASVTYDSVGPTPVISNTYTSATSTSPVSFTVTFNEPVVAGEFTASDIVLSGSANPTSATVSTTDNQIFTVLVKGMNASGDVTLNIAAGAAHDAAGNESSAAAENSASFTLVTTPQLVLPSTTPQPWFYYDEVNNNLIPSNTNPGTDFVQELTIPAHGIGAARVKSLTGQKTLFFTPAYNGSRFDELTEFSFWFKQDATDLAAKSPYVNFGIDFDSTDAISETTYQGRLTYIPNVTITPGTWQKIDLTTGVFYLTSSMPASSTACRTQNNLCTLQQILTAYPNLNLPDEPFDNPSTPHYDALFGFGLIGIRVDGGTEGFTGYIDGIVVGKNSSNTDFDFEPAAMISLSDPSATYDGDPHGATATTTPSGLTVDLEYTGVSPTVYAVSSTPPTNAGSYSVTGTINNPPYVGSATQAFTIGKATPTVTVTASPASPSDYGTPVTFTATVAKAGINAAIPTGTVTFKDGSTVLCSTVALAVGEATCVATLGASTTPHSITAEFVADSSENNYLGNVSPALLYTVNKAPATITLSDLSHTYDGTAKSATATTSPTGLSGVTITYDSSTTAPTAAGSYAVEATLTNDNYTAPPATETLVIAKATPTATLTASPASPQDYGTSVTFTATVAKAGSSALTPTGTVTFMDGTTALGTAVTLDSNGVAEYITSNLSAATHPITAVYTPAMTENNYNGSTSNELSYVIEKADQTITFDPLGGKTYGDADFSISATASSNLDVSFSSTTPSVCTIISSSSIHIVGAGECTIRASQAGDSNYEAATPVDQSFTVAKFTPTVTVTGGTFTYNTMPHPATGLVTGANGEDLGSPTFTYTPGGSSAPVNAGSYLVVGSFAENSNYNSATSSSATITINKANQTITFDPIDDKYYGDPDFDVVASASSGLPLTLTASSSPIAELCTITGVTVDIAGAGTCTITASQGGNENYNPATPNNVQQSFDILTLNDPVSVSIANPTTRVTLHSSGPVTINVPVTVSDVTNHGFTAFEFTVSYDQSKLTPTAVPIVTETGDVAFSYSGGFTSNVTTPGSLAVAGSGEIPLAGVGRLLSLQFTANEIGCSDISFGTPHTFVFNNGTNPLTVTTGTVCVAEDTTTTVSFGSGPFTYTGNLFTATVSVTGNRTGDTLTAPTVTYSGDCLNVTVADGCSASASFAGDDTHNASSDSDSITITKAPLTVTANNKMRRYNEANPLLDAAITGYVNSETFGTSSGVTGAPDCTTTATPTTPVADSPVPIVCTIGTLTANNYSFAFVAGELTIEKADQEIIDFDPIIDKLIDAPNFTVTATGGDSGNAVTFTTSSSACSVTSSGDVDVLNYGLCTITAQQAGNDNYNAAPDVSRSFNVIPYTTNLNVSLPPSPVSSYHGTPFAVPVSISETGLHAINSITFDLSYDSSKWNPALTFVTGTSCGGTVSAIPSSGVVDVTITAPPSSYLSGSCSVVFNFVSSNTGSSSFEVSNFVYSSDTPTAHTGTATFSNNPYSVNVTNGNITGTITNFHNLLAVPGVLLTADGVPVVTGTTDAAGVYDLFGFGDGSYTVTPTKTAETRTTATSNGSILSNDVTMIQRHRVGLCPVVTPLPTDPCPSPWNTKMQAAADVDQNGFVQSFDAALIQQFRAGIPNVVNQTGRWKFTDASKTYADVFTPKTAQDYTALLLGDVDGSWNVPVSSLALKGGKTRTDEKTGSTEYVKPQVLNLSPLAVNVALPTASLPTNATVTQEITVGDMTGQNVTSYDFDIVYDPAVVQPSLSLVNKEETLSGNMSVVANVVTPGRLAVSASGINPLNGSGVLLKLIWRTVGNSGDTTPITFDPFIFNGGNPSATVTNGQISLSVATAQQASISGRVISPDTKGLGGAIVLITGQNGQTVTTRTNNFGVFTVSGLPVGQTYIINARAKGYTFGTQTLNLLSDEENLEIMALP